MQGIFYRIDKGNVDLAAYDDVNAISVSGSNSNQDDGSVARLPLCLVLVSPSCPDSLFPFLVFSPFLTPASDFNHDYLCRALVLKLVMSLVSTQVPLPTLQDAYDVASLS